VRRTGSDGQPLEAFSSSRLECVLVSSPGQPDLTSAYRSRLRLRLLCDLGKLHVDTAL